MHSICIYCPVEDFDKIVKDRLSEEDAEEFKDCMWVPARIAVNENFEIEVLAIPAK